MKDDLIGRNVSIPMTSDELNRWDNYLNREGLKRGGMVRKLILRELAHDDALQAGRTQADPRFFMRVVPETPESPANPHAGVSQ